MVKHWSASVGALIAANLVPLFGVFFFGWDLFALLVLFWAENVVVGIYAFCRVALVREKIAIRILTMILFAFHFGLFTAVHGMFVYALFGKGYVPITAILLGFFSLVLSHGVSFFTNYVGKKEYIKTTTEKEMHRPYRRVVVMHLTIIFGGMLSGLFHEPLFALLILVFLKIVIDVSTHIREHHI